MKRLFLIVSASAVIAGCANYADVAKLNLRNQTYLKTLDEKLGPNERKEGAYKKIASSRAATVRAVSQAGVADIEAKARFTNTDAQRIYLNAQTARLQTEFNHEADDAIHRANLLKTLDGRIADAAKALHENGQDIQRYLELGFFERLFTDVRGMDTTKLKQIGDDLKSLSERLAPGLSGALQGGSKP